MHGKGGKGKKLMWSPLYEVLVTCYLLPGSAGESRLVVGYQCARANRCDHLPPKQHRTYTVHTLLIAACIRFLVRTVSSCLVLESMIGTRQSAMHITVVLCKGKGIYRKGTAESYISFTTVCLPM